MVELVRINIQSFWSDDRVKVYHLPNKPVGYLLKANAIYREPTQYTNDSYVVLNEEMHNFLYSLGEFTYTLDYEVIMDDDIDANVTLLLYLNSKDNAVMFKLTYG